MKRAAFLLLCASLAFVLAGCPGPGAGRYPTNISGIGDTPGYPLRAAGFEREKIVSYAPGNVDVSVGYNMLTREAQIMSTIYLIAGAARNDTPEQYFSKSRTALEQYRSGAELLAEDTVVLTRDGRTFTAQRAAYRYEMVFSGRRQRVYSVLMVWRNGDDIIKLRTTTPLTQRNLSASNNLNLLNAVDWTTLPY